GCPPNDPGSKSTVWEGPTWGIPDKWGDDAFVDLANGRNDAVLTDAGESISWLKRDQGGCCAFVGEAVVSDDLIGIAIREDDDDLRAMFNKAIAAIRADGTYQRINDKYFPFSIY
ncbi:MAG: transporter substrate-binding domain-containing protein, partial [Proteobacteria bacterium]|nr:transporter substrate-binding domain-containing protein [Pseudomonadota bacterium]